MIKLTFTGQSGRDACKLNYAIRKEVESAFKLVDTLLQENAAEVLNSLAPPASLQQILAAEKRLTFKLPESLRHVYRIHNGQNYSSFFSKFGLFGNGIVFENCNDIRKCRLVGEEEDCKLLEIASNTDFSNLTLVVDVTTEKVLLANVNDDSYYAVADSIVHLLRKVSARLAARQFSYFDIFNYEL